MNSLSETAVFLVLSVAVSGCGKSSDQGDAPQPRGQASVQERVVKIVACQLGRDPTDVPIEATLIGTLGADELDVVEIVISLEDEFGIPIPDENFMDKNARRSLGIPGTLNTKRLVEVVEDVLREKANGR